MISVATGLAGFANYQSEQYGSNWPEHENSFQFGLSQKEPQFPAYVMHYESQNRNICMYPAELNTLDGHIKRLQEQERERQHRHPEEMETNFYIPVVKNNYGQYQYLITDNDAVWHFFNSLTLRGHCAEPRNRIIWRALERQLFATQRQKSRADMSHNVTLLNAQLSKTLSSAQEQLFWCDTCGNVPENSEHSTQGQCKRITVLPQHTTRLLKPLSVDTEKHDWWLVLKKHYNGTFVDLSNRVLILENVTNTTANATVEIENETNFQHIQPLTIDMDDALCSSSGSGKRSEQVFVDSFFHDQFLQRTSVQNPKQMLPAEQTLDMPSHSHYHTEQSPRYQTASVQNYLVPNENPTGVVTTTQQSLANLPLQMPLQPPAGIPFPEILRRTCFGISEVQQKLKVQNALSIRQLSTARVNDVETAVPLNSNTLRETNTVLSNSDFSEEIGCKKPQLSNFSSGRSKPQLFKWSQSRNSPTIQPEVATKRRLDTEQNIILGAKLQKRGYLGEQRNSRSRIRDYK